MTRLVLWCGAKTDGLVGVGERDPGRDWEGETHVTMRSPKWVAL